MMVTRKRKDDEPETEPEVSANDPHTTPAPPPAPSDDDAVSEYEMPDGLTYLLSAREAKQRGAKAVGTPSNKAAKPQNK